jgi:hypothetical protein
MGRRVIVSIPIVPIVTDEGTQYFFAEGEFLKQVREWKCHPKEVPHYAFDDWCGPPCPSDSYYCFKRNDDPPEGAVIRLFIPNDHPAALMAKLVWGGV